MDLKQTENFENHFPTTTYKAGLIQKKKFFSEFFLYTL